MDTEISMKHLADHTDEAARLYYKRKSKDVRETLYTKIQFKLVPKTLQDLLKKEIGEAYIYYNKDNDFVYVEKVSSQIQQSYSNNDNFESDSNDNSENESPSQTNEMLQDNVLYGHNPNIIINDLRNMRSLMLNPDENNIPSQVIAFIIQKMHENIWSLTGTQTSNQELNEYLYSFGEYLTLRDGEDGVCYIHYQTAIIIYDKLQALHPNYSEQFLNKLYWQSYNQALKDIISEEKEITVPESKKQVITPFKIIES